MTTTKSTLRTLLLLCGLSYVLWNCNHRTILVEMESESIGKELSWDTTEEKVTWGDGGVLDTSSVEEEAVEDEVSDYREWPPPQTLPDLRGREGLCSEGYVIQNQSYQNNVMNEILPRLGCVDHLGTWLENQDCIWDVIAHDQTNNNSTNPPYRYISFEARMKGYKQAGGDLSVYDTKTYRPDCIVVCKDNIVCLGRFSLSRISIFGYK